MVRCEPPNKQLQRTVTRCRGRHFVITVAVLLVAGAARAVADTATADIFVQARLIALDRGPHGGVLHVGSPATYEVIAGPTELVGKQIHVMVDCAEMPRSGSAADGGDLKSFEVGATHFLSLAKENVRRITTPRNLPTGGDWFYLRAASLERLQPDTSLERADGR